MKLNELKRMIESASENAEIKVENGEIVITEPESEDITERIKTFEDACRWCNENDKAYLVGHWECISEDLAYADGMSDLFAYLKLRIITTALNEGWEPTEEGFSFTALYRENGGGIEVSGISGYYCDSSIKLCFKSEELANYAAEQFRDIYEDFCCIKKGGAQ